MDRRSYVRFDDGRSCCPPPITPLAPHLPLSDRLWASPLNFAVLRVRPPRPCLQLARRGCSLPTRLEPSGRWPFWSPCDADGLISSGHELLFIVACVFAGRIDRSMVKPFSTIWRTMSGGGTLLPYYRAAAPKLGSYTRFLVPFPWCTPFEVALYAFSSWDTQQCSTGSARSWHADGSVQKEGALRGPHVWNTWFPKPSHDTIHGDSASKCAWIQFVSKRLSFPDVARYFISASITWTQLSDPCGERQVIWGVRGRAAARGRIGASTEEGRRHRSPSSSRQGAISSVHRRTRLLPLLGIQGKGKDPNHFYSCFPSSSFPSDELVPRLKMSEGSSTSVHNCRNGRKHSYLDPSFSRIAKHFFS